MKSYYSHGKLLLTGEYLVLDGAKALAIPTRFGQELKVEENTSGVLQWVSLDENEKVWFEDTFKIQNNEILKQVQNDNSISNRLLQILNKVKHLNPDFLNDNLGYKFTTQLEFPRTWGLGTSSTLICNLANYANVNPYQLLEITFGGSGYDIACAEAQGSITFQLEQENGSSTASNDKKQLIDIVDFNPPFKDHLYFVYLNRKQNSRDGISKFRSNNSDLHIEISEVNGITQDIIECKNLTDFQRLITNHENIISKIIDQKPIKEEVFNDFKGSIKSLGAWGGDFVLAASSENPSEYFKQRGFHTIIEYDQMVLS